MFEPPFCPNPSCPYHLQPSQRFFKLHGTFWPNWSKKPIARMRCKRCNTTFSRQTFCMSRYDRRPEVNAELFSRLASSGGLRQSARELGLSPSGVQWKFRKIARHLLQLHRHRIRPVHAPLCFIFDEAESFEGSRLEAPLTVPFVVERNTMFLVDARCGTLPPRPSAPSRQPAKSKGESESRSRRARKNESKRVVGESLAMAAQLVATQESIEFRCDQKSTYPGLIRSSFARVCAEGEHDLRANLSIRICQTNSREPRTPLNPLHRINLTLAMARDQMGRMRRRSWLATKKREYLDLHLGLFLAYRNYVRVRFNEEVRTPAELLGLMPRSASCAELLTWRQDWAKERVLHPFESCEHRGPASA
ncbi:MAG: hypothetical protein AB7I19_06525 [Planctomycetota bacterium]